MADVASRPQSPLGVARLVNQRFQDRSREEILRSLKVEFASLPDRRNMPPLIHEDRDGDGPNTLRNLIQECELPEPIT